MLMSTYLHIYRRRRNSANSGHWHLCFKVGPRTEMAARAHHADHALNHKVTCSLMSMSMTILNFPSMYVYNVHLYLQISIHQSASLNLKFKIGLVDAWRRERGARYYSHDADAKQTGDRQHIQTNKFQIPKNCVMFVCKYVFLTPVSVLHYLLKDKQLTWHLTGAVMKNKYLHVLNVLCFNVCLHRLE